MSKHDELIKSLRASAAAMPFDAAVAVQYRAAADALEAQAREIEGLQEQLASNAKSAFEAMPHDIPRRMKRKICVETGWSMSMVSRAYIELRAAFTGEKYTANEDLDAARAEIEGLRKDARRAEQLEQLARYMFEADNDYGAGFSGDPNWRLWYTRLADLVGVQLESTP